MVYIFNLPFHSVFPEELSLNIFSVPLLCYMCYICVWLSSLNLLGCLCLRLPQVFNVYNLVFSNVYSVPCFCLLVSLIFNLFSLVLQSPFPSHSCFITLSLSVILQIMLLLTCSTAALSKKTFWDKKNVVCMHYQCNIHGLHVAICT